MKPVFLIGSGPSLRALTHEERTQLAHLPCIATSVYVRWPDAWQPWGYVVCDFVDLGVVTQEVDARWPTINKFFTTVPAEFRPLVGWTWIKRRGTHKIEKGQWSNEFLSYSMAYNPLWYVVQLAARLGQNWDTFVLLGSEHTPEGYAHDPAMAHVRNLSVSRYECWMLSQMLAQRGITLLDASGPTSTLEIPRVTLQEVLKC